MFFGIASVMDAMPLTKMLRKAEKRNERNVGLGYSCALLILQNGTGGVGEEHESLTYRQ